MANRAPSDGRRHRFSPPPLEAPPAYFLTFTTYGTRLHGDAHGTVDRYHSVFDTPRLPDDFDRRRRAGDRMRGAPVVLSPGDRAVVESAIRFACDRRGWTLHAVNVRSNHAHVVLSAAGKPEPVLSALKAWATRRLVEGHAIAPDTRIWTRHGSTKYLWTTKAIEDACRYVREGQGGARE